MKCKLPESDREPCWKHSKVGYKKGCRDCFDKYRDRVNDRDDDWHLSWERDNFGDN